MLQPPARTCEGHAATPRIHCHERDAKELRRGVRDADIMARAMAVATSLRALVRDAFCLRPINPYCFIINAIPILIFI